MASTPWRNENWFVSPWNFAPEVTADWRFPKSIQIHDVTLRDGEQQSRVVFTKEDKIRIAEKLAEAGVHRIEAGTPAVSKDDADAVREIARRKLGPKTFVLTRCMVEDVKRAAELRHRRRRSWRSRPASTWWSWPTGGRWKRPSTSPFVPPERLTRPASTSCSSRSTRRAPTSTGT